MRINKFALVIGFAITSLLFFEVAAHAAQADESTKLTFSNPIEIPGQVLPAGTYLFKLADSNDMNVVRIFDADGTHLYATLDTVSAERPASDGYTVVTLAEQSDGKPYALLTWFYAGDTIGHEFVYPAQERQQLAQSPQQTIEAKETAEAAD